jgi:hypothetical protein
VPPNVFPPKGGCDVDRLVGCGVFLARSVRRDEEADRAIPAAWADGTGTVPAGRGLRPGTPPSPLDRDVSMGGVGRRWGPLLCPALPQATTRGRPPVSTRGWLAWAGLQHAWACAAAQLCRRVRTDRAVMDACGIEPVPVEGAQAQVGLPEVLAPCRRRLDAPLLAERRAIQAVTALAGGLVSLVHLVVDTFPRAPGSPRVNAAAPLEKAPPKVSRSSRPAPRTAPPETPRAKGESTRASTPCQRCCAAGVASAGGGGRWW